MKRLIVLLGCLVCMAAPTAAEDRRAEGPTPLGQWVTASGNLEVDVARCGEALCGTVVRVLANHSMSRAGEEMKPADARDPIGMQILSEFVPVEFGASHEPTQWKGNLYNRENAKTYRCLMWIGDRGELVLRAYVGLPWFGRTSAWTRPVTAAATER